MKHKKQWITALAISALTVGGTSVWAASNTTDTTGNAPKWHHADKGKHFDHTILLKKLDITTAEAEAAREAGKTIAQLAEEKGIPFADYKKAELAAAKEQLDALVKSGDLTKTQAADMLERHTERFADATSYDDLPDRDMKRGMHGPGGFFGESIIPAVLKALGLDADKFEEANKSLAEYARSQQVKFADFKKALLAAQKAELEQQVKDGKITEDQAARIKERIEAKFAEATSYDDLEQEKGRGEMRGMMGDSATDVLKALGLDESKFEESGKSLHAFAESEGVKYAAFEKALVAAQKADIDQLVKDGKITEKQATEMRAHIDEHAAEQNSYDDIQGREGRGFGGAGRGHGGPGGHGGFGPGMHQDSNSDSSTDSDDDVATEATAI